MREIIVDSFAGGGGASTGIELALGRSPDVAINHDPEALALHAANHPETHHVDSNIWDVSPTAIAAGRPIGLLWASPDCKHFSKAKGGKPLDRNIRDLAWVVVRWAEEVRPRIIILENVEEFRTWGPLYEDGAPIPQLRGQTFDDFVRRLRKAGYRVQHRELRACDYGAPTIRKRLFLIARRDGRPIVWPRPTHGKPGSPAVVARKLLPWRAAAEIIDWSLPCPSIFDTAEEIWKIWGIRAKRPLAEATMARIARGVWRYVIEAAEPFIVPLTHHGDRRPHPSGEPLPTVTGAHRGELALVEPFVSRFTENGIGSCLEEPLDTVMAGAAKFGLVAPFVAYGQQGGAVRDLEDPLHTVTASPKDTNALVAPVLVNTANGKTTGRGPNAWPAEDPTRTITPGNGHAVVAPFLVPRYGERDGQAARCAEVDEPMPTIVPAGNEGSLVAPFLSRQFGASIGSDVEDPVGTITAGGGGKAAVVAAFLAQHNTDVVGHEATEPVSTIVGKGCTQGLVAAHLVNMRGADRRDGPATMPCPTLSAQGNHVGAVTAFLCKYYGTGGQLADCRDPSPTDTAKPRFGLVMVEGVPHRIVDIGMRMLTPRERYSAQGFPANYIIDVEHKGRRLTLEAQGRMVGNSVCPPLARALAAANCADMTEQREAAE